MCGSTLDVKGGMTSVVKNYLNYDNWEDTKVTFIATHTSCNRVLLLLFFFTSYLRILLHITFNKIHIAHLHTAEKGSFYRKAFLVQTFKRFGIKIILHHHAAEFEEFYSNSSHQQQNYIARILELSDLNIVLSKRLVSMIHSKAPNARIKVLYNAVNIYKRNTYNNSARNVLFLGRLGKRKGAYDLLSSIKYLDNIIDSDIKFYLCGDGEIEEVKSRAKQMGISHRIAHIGWIDGTQKQDFLKNTMINVLPSYNEGLPMTILETMAYGIPNISTNIASIPEVITNGDTGFMIVPGDVDGLSKSLHKLIDSKELRESISNHSFCLISEHFSLDNNIYKLKKIYKSVI